jgi:hypothetical protein
VTQSSEPGEMSDSDDDDEEDEGECITKRVECFGRDDI